MKLYSVSIMPIDSAVYRYAYHLNNKPAFKSDFHIEYRIKGGFHVPFLKKLFQFETLSNNHT